jgi:gamma-glutamyltranspeptidase / glutathione hydrolase
MSLRTGWRPGILAALCSVWLLAAADEGPPAVAVASAHPAATEAGLTTLAAGGNAFDAAVAVAAALAVVEPASSGLGGGGFFLLHRAHDGWSSMLDARETAPAAASRDMYLDEQGEAVKERSRDGPLAAGIPGLPAALVRIAAEHGRQSLAASLAPAIRLAAEGFLVTPRHQAMTRARLELLAAAPATREVFLVDGAVPELGHRLLQPELARTLQALADQGAQGFYAGPVAEQLVAGVRAAGGIWTLADLAGYRTVWRDPLVARFREFTVTSAPLPSSGGTVLIEALNILEGLDLPAPGEVGRVHLVVEAMRRAYRDRAAYLGDPDFVQAPIARLIDKDYAASLRANISTTAATRSADLPALPPAGEGYPNTTHFSVLDADGNRVAATLSINLPFGSGFMPPGTGVLLNDEMDDFAVKPMTPNAYGLVGADANAVAPGKRPLSSMSPTFIEAPDRIGILGTPGGSRIISMVLLGLLSFAEGEAPSAWVATPRYHHQYLPDELLHEAEAFTPDQAAALTALGHELKLSNRRYGDMHAILWRKQDGVVEAASDPRGEGLARVLPVAQPTPGEASRQTQ